MNVSKSMGNVPGTQSTDVDTSVVFRGDGEPKTIKGYLEQMNAIESGDAIESDTYSRGGAVGRLEERAAQMLGKEAAIFMPSGTLANHLAIRKHCGIKPRAIVQEQCHLFNDCGDCVQQLSSINMVPLAKDRPYFTLEELQEAVERSETGRVLSPVGAVMIESPVRRQTGQIVPLDVMDQITGYCADAGIPTHLDGARLYMMAAATGVSASEYALKFDTVYVSLYKYFGAPFGAVLAGPGDFIDGMYHERRMFGGGLSSAALVAAIALKGMEGFEERYGEAMTKAKDLFIQLDDLDGLKVHPFEHGSNIFPLELDERVDTGKFIEVLKCRSVLVNTREGTEDQIDLAVNTTVLRQSNEELLDTFAYALGSSRTR